MCGYCVETLAIDILEAARAGILHANVVAGSPLALEMLAQEGDPALAMRHRALGDADWPSALTLRCRRIEALVASGVSLAKAVPSSGHALFDGWTVPADPPARRDSDAAAAVLDRFTQWWPRQNPDAGTFDPMGWSVAKADKARELEMILPELWAAQAIVFRQPLSARVVAIARRMVSMPLPYTPAFQAWDLWLQRRAMMAWHAHEGDVAIEAAAVTGVRTELVQYVRVRQRRRGD